MIQSIHNILKIQVLTLAKHRNIEKPLKRGTYQITFAQKSSIKNPPQNPQKQSHFQLFNNKTSRNFVIWSINPSQHFKKTDFLTSRFYYLKSWMYHQHHRISVFFFFRFSVSQSTWANNKKITLLTIPNAEEYNIFYINFFFLENVKYNFHSYYNFIIFQSHNNDIKKRNKHIINNNIRNVRGAARKRCGVFWIFCLVAVVLVEIMKPTDWPTESVFCLV